MSKLFRHKTFQRYFFNTGWLLADKALRLLVGLFIGVYVARYLGPSRFGLLSFATSFVSLFSILSTMGLETIIVRNAVLFPGSRDELMGTAFGLRMASGLLLPGIVFFAIQTIDNDPFTRLLAVIIAGGYAFQAFFVIELYFQSQVLARPASMAGIFALCAAAAIKLILIWSKASLVWFAWVFVVEQGIKSIVLCVLYAKQRLSFLGWRFRLSQAKQLIKDAWPLILSGLMIVIYMRIDQIMIKKMLDVASVGNYAAAVRLSESWYFVPLALTQSLFPAILSAKKQNEDLFNTRMEQLYALLFWLGIIVALPMTFLSDWLVITLFGEGYQRAGSVLAIHIWAGVFVGLAAASGRWYVIHNLQVLTFSRNLIGAVVNIILNLLLIPKFGLNGAALATVISFTAAGFLFDVFNRKTRIVFTMKIRSIYYPLRYFTHLRVFPPRRF